LIMGIETRTSSLREANPQTAAIPQLWHQFLTEQLWLTIPDVVNPQVLYGIYTDYDACEDLAQASDEKCHATSTLSYRLIVAAEVSNIDNPPEQMVGITIPSARYLVFSSIATDRPADTAQETRQTWQQIWHYFSYADLPYQRAYTTDFECYGQDRISVYVAVR
jgi:predicted transcriptional regulator YdeE